MVTDLENTILITDKIKIRNQKSPYNNRIGKVVDIEEFKNDNGEIVKWFVCGIFNTGVKRARFLESEIQRVR